MLQASSFAVLIGSELTDDLEGVPVRTGVRLLKVLRPDADPVRSARGEVGYMSTVFLADSTKRNPQMTEWLGERAVVEVKIARPAGWNRLQQPQMRHPGPPGTRAFARAADTRHLGMKVLPTILCEGAIRFDHAGDAYRLPWQIIEHLPAPTLRLNVEYQLSLHGRGMPRARVARIAMQLLDAITAFHGAQPMIVHRGLTSDNILLLLPGYADEVKILDWTTAWTSDGPQTTALYGDDRTAATAPAIDIAMVAEIVHFLVSGCSPLPSSRDAPAAFRSCIAANSASVDSTFGAGDRERLERLDDVLNRAFSGRFADVTQLAAELLPILTSESSPTWEPVDATWIRSDPGSRPDASEPLLHGAVYSDHSAMALSGGQLWRLLGNKWMRISSPSGAETPLRWAQGGPAGLPTIRAGNRLLGWEPNGASSWGYGWFELPGIADPTAAAGDPAVAMLTISGRAIHVLRRGPAGGEGRWSTHSLQLPQDELGRTAGYFGHRPCRYPWILGGERRTPTGVKGWVAPVVAPSQAAISRLSLGAPIGLPSPVNALDLTSSCDSVVAVGENGVICVVSLTGEQSVEQIRLTSKPSLQFVACGDGGTWVASSKQIWHLPAMSHAPLPPTEMPERIIALGLVQGGVRALLADGTFFEREA